MPPQKKSVGKVEIEAAVYLSVPYFPIYHAERRNCRELAPPVPRLFPKEKKGAGPGCQLPGIRFDKSNPYF